MRRHASWTFGLLLLIVGGAACKQPSKSGDTGGITWPDRVKSGDGDATVANKVGVLGTGGGKTISVDLERSMRGGEGAVWACWSTPPDDFALGRAVCTSDSKKTQEITAANVDKTCGNSPDFGTIKAKTPLSLADCPAYEIFAYEFNPPMLLSIGE